MKLANLFKKAHRCTKPPICKQCMQRIEENIWKQNNPAPSEPLATALGFIMVGSMLWFIGFVALRILGAVFR